MAQEGIMALPMGQGMQGRKGEQTPSVTSADSYDAATTAQGMVDPQSLAVVKESLRQNLADLELTPGQLDMLIEMFEYISQRPDQYKELVRSLVAQDIVDEGDMPEDYDPAFIGAILAALNEIKLMRGETAMAPMMEGPGAEAQGPMPMAKGGLADAAQYLASKGRYGDTMLAHITPEEADMLQRMGGSGTINPETGLPEFFLKKIFSAVKSVVKSVVNVVKKALQSPVGKILGTIALATVLGPTAIGLTLGSAGTAALASGAVTLASGGSLKEALVAGAMGYIGGGGTFGGVSPLKAVGEFLPGAAGSALNTGLTTGALGTGAGLLMGMKPADALKMGATAGLVSGGIQGMSNFMADRAVSAKVSDMALAGDQKAAEAFMSRDYNKMREFLASQGNPATAPGPVNQVGQTGTTGTAQDLLMRGQGLQPGQGGEGFKLPGSFGSQDLSVGAGGTGYDTNYTLLPRNTLPSEGLQPAPFTAADLSRAAGGTGGTTNYTLAARAPGAVTPAAPTGFVDRMVQGAKDIYNEYLSPSRPGLPADAGILRKYGPLAAAGTAVVAAAGGMEGDPANPSPLYNQRYTSDDYMRDNPDKFRGGLDKPVVTPPSGFVPTPSYATREITNIPISLPGGVTQSPAGVAQPYNVAGLYGVPILYGPPPGRAKGGEMTMEDFPRKTGPINGPGTGTSDSIPAMLSDGEFVFTAKAVRNAGNGSRRKGAARMYKLMKMLEGGAVKGK
jgi:hypothetical protein